MKTYEELTEYSNDILSDTFKILKLRQDNEKKTSDKFREYGKLMLLILKVLRSRRKPSSGTILEQELNKDK
jgi:hypothetical protein